MAFGMKRGFLSMTRNKGASIERDAERIANTTDTRFQFSNVCRVYSESPRIVLADHRISNVSYFLFLPAKDANIVFVDSLEGVQAISKWPLWDKPRLVPPLNPPFVIQDCGEKGVGMFVRRPIARGELIMLERPVYVAHPKVSVHSDQKTAFYEAALAGLSPATQATITSLRNAQPLTPEVSHVRGVLLTNALHAVVSHPYAETAARHTALFPTLCRANHACTPNAHFFFCTETFAGRLHALRRIVAGEEITVGYTDLAAPRAQRRADLARYAFECACATCGLPEAASDARRVAIGAYLMRMKLGGKTPAGAELAQVEELVHAAEDEGLVECASVLAISALRLAQHDGDHAAVLRLTVDAMNYVRALEGNDSAGFVKLAARMGLSAPQLAAIFDNGTPGSFDYAFFGRLLQENSQS
ncbi:hypothetical protein FB451DRAFT_1456312 [Mycena latifolia]|nr:hypothetical protein FB451DRAFT_1456312 [Mycena latifolia]